MPADEVTCRCGHGRSAHEHYRAGTECSVCPDCPRFRPGRPVRRFLGLLLHRPQR